MTLLCYYHPEEWQSSRLDGEKMLPCWPLCHFYGAKDGTTNADRAFQEDI